MKHLLSLMLAAGISMAAHADPNWKMHTTFDEEVTRIVDADDFVYFVSRTQPYDKRVAETAKDIFSLFRYDKVNDEMLSLSTDNILSSNTVSNIEYSPEKGMLVVVYTNYDIDLIYDDGKTANIPAYRLAAVATGKKVNSIFIDEERDRIYLSTEFGYVALNDKKREVAESRIYNAPVLGMSRAGDDLLLLKEDELLAAPASAPRFNLSDYTKVADVKKGLSITQVSPERSIVIDSSSVPQALFMLEKNGEGYSMKKIIKDSFFNIEHNSLGVTVPVQGSIYQFYKDGSYEAIERQAEDHGMSVGSHDLTEFWHGTKRRGISSKNYRKNDGEWTLTRDFMRPDGPAPFKATEMVWHPQHGLLVVNHGYDRNFDTHPVDSPILLSAYKDGFWSNLSPAYTYPEGVMTLMNPNGLAVDPDNPDLMYFGSVLHGLERINVKEGSETLHLSRKSDPYRDQPGFVEIVDDQKGLPSPALGGDKSWRASCSFSGPAFDADGNMWVTYTDFDDQTPIQMHIFCWEADARRSSVDAASYQPMKLLRVPGPLSSNRQIIKPLTTSRNRNILLVTNSSYSGEIVMIDTKGTPADGGDDNVVRITSYYDQDGANFDVHYVSCFYEDPLTGNVWVGHGDGVFYFNPADYLEGNERVTRIKVARNDGTNLADYLLNLVTVNRITVDGEGRKWFATSGAGVVCTSADGRKIEEELTTSNSPLPADIVYGIGYVADNNSMMFSTDNGIAEYFLKSSGSATGSSSVRAYPNPVRPDYYGYVTIDGLEDGALVKIVDSRGHLVKELGTAGGGEVKWDVTNLSFKRVGSGVYFILASSGENSGNYSNVGKILVVN